MDDLISRQVAMEMLMAQNVIMDGSEYHNGFNAGVNRAQEVIRNLPSVQPNHNAEVSKMEIIHCKDCKHHWVHRCMDSPAIEKYDLNQTFYDADYDFCSLAERRTE